MISSNLFHRLLGSILAATAVALASSTTTPQLLDPGDVILLGANGRTEIMHRDVYSNMTLGGKTLRRDAALGGFPTSNTTFHNQNGPAKIRRRCDSYDLYAIDSQTDFEDWDVPMSSVVFANGNTTIILVTSGYTVSNAIAVNVGFEAELEKWLSVEAGVTYTYTWTTTTTAGYSYSVPAGKYAVIVSNPRTHRISGHIDSGCIGDPDSTNYFTADNRFSQNYGGLVWVEGVIQLCISATYPVPRCIGGGFLY